MKKIISVITGIFMFTMSFHISFAQVVEPVDKNKIANGGYDMVAYLPTIRRRREPMNTRLNTMEQNTGSHLRIINDCSCSHRKNTCPYVMVTAPGVWRKKEKKSLSTR